ncbi:MAG: succinate dehydrogenase assembly factor 2 [Bordetella sp.]|nr:MAG: succinate dehydrogenase assembly factor 2 [Bordetella sp.]
MAKLRWNARRGLLESDLIIKQYLDTYENQLTDLEIEALNYLLSMEDNDLLDLLLSRTKLNNNLENPILKSIVKKMQDIKFSNIN